jgi:antitoxin YefM
MKAITYTAAREGLAAAMDQVCQDRAPMIITRNRDQAVVLMSLDDYEELEETAHLLRSPANARRLLEAIQSLESGRGIEHKLPADA